MWFSNNSKQLFHLTASGQLAVRRKAWGLGPLGSLGPRSYVNVALETPWKL